MTRIAGSRVGVLGGSIAGCAVATALGRAGCEVVVFERSSGELRDRGAGILMPVPLHEELVERGYIDGDYRPWSASERCWVVRDGEAPTGRVIWRQPSPSLTNNWGVFWHSLRSQVPDACYRDGARVVDLRRTDDRWTVHTADGAEDGFDVVVGADGYRSLVRSRLHPESRAAYAGYVLWRGGVEERDVTDRADWDASVEDGRWWTVCFPGGHGVLYPIPGSDGRSEPGQRRINWAIYCTPPATERFADPVSVPPGWVDPELVPSLVALLDEHFPPYLAGLIRQSIESDALFIQPIYDELVTTYVGDGVLLAGDASTVARPHTGSGSTKAIQDAMALEEICATQETWEAALAAYDARRCTAGVQLVELGRRIGAAQVQETPEWGAMDAETMQAWTAATLSGQRLYFYGEQDRPD